MTDIMADYLGDVINYCHSFESMRGTRYVACVPASWSRERVEREAFAQTSRVSYTQNKTGWDADPASVHDCQDHAGRVHWFARNR